MKRLVAIASVAVLIVVVSLGSVAIFVGMLTKDGPKVAIQDYLAALQSSDAERALARLDNPPHDKSLLNNKMLIKLNKANRGVGKVHSVTDHEARVDLAGKPVTLRFSPVRKQGAWRIQGVASVSVVHPSAVRLQVEKVATSSRSWYLFPGEYDISAINPLVTIGTKLRVETTTASEFHPEVTLADNAEAALRTNLIQSVRNCAQAKTLAPAGCPWAFTGPDNAIIDQSTISVSFPDELAAIKNASFQLDEAVYATAKIALVVRVEAKAEMESKAGTANLKQDLTVTTVAMVGLATAEQRIIWQGR